MAFRRTTQRMQSACIAACPWNRQPVACENVGSALPDDSDSVAHPACQYAGHHLTVQPIRVQATLDLHDELFLARYCSCPAFNGSQHGYGTYSSAYSPSYRNNPNYRSFDDDDDEYDYVDDYDDFESGSTFGHVQDDDEFDSEPAGRRRYTGMCKHVAAMLLLFLDQPERFRGFKQSGVTSPILSDYMRALNAKNDNTGQSAQLDVLKRSSTRKAVSPTNNEAPLRKGPRKQNARAVPS